MERTLEKLYYSVVRVTEAVPGRRTMSGFEKRTFGELTKSIRVRTIDGSYYKFRLNDVSRYDFEYTPTVLRVDFKDGTFIEFTRQNIIFAGIGIDAYTIRERKEQNG